MPMLEYSSFLDRKIRTDSPPELGISTFCLVERSLDSGQWDAATELFSYMRTEFAIIYAFMVNWSSDLLGYIADHWGGELREQARQITYPRYREFRPQQLSFLNPDQQRRALRRIEAFLVEAEDPQSLGERQEKEFREAVQAGDADSAKEAAEDLWKEYLFPHDVIVTWINDLLTLIAEKGGENSVPEAIDVTYQKRWKKRYARWNEMTAEQKLQLSVEGMRGHLSGLSRKGDVIVEEEEDRYVMRFDPCGSGGVLKRGDPVTGAPPYPTTGVNREPHPWTWSTTGVHWYSTHCPIVMEWKTTFDFGYPMRPIDYQHDPQKPCTWYIYKKPEACRSEHYERMGIKRPGRID